MMKRVFLVVLLISGVAFAGDLGVNFTSPGAQNSSSLWSLGYQFTANMNATVTGLGTFDYNQDGFAQDQQVGLWDSAGNLLASTYVSNGDPLTGFWRFHPIAGVTLVTGDTYYVASQGGEGYTYTTGGFTVAPEITYVLDAWHYNANTFNDPLAFPDSTESITQAGGGAFFGGNVEFGTATPEPGTLLMLGTGLLGGIGVIRRKLMR
jgi:hypothetical protein